MVNVAALVGAREDLPGHLSWLADVTAMPDQGEPGAYVNFTGDEGPEGSVPRIPVRPGSGSRSSSVGTTRPTCSTGIRTSHRPTHERRPAGGRAAARAAQMPDDGGDIGIEARVDLRAQALAGTERRPADPEEHAELERSAEGRRKSDDDRHWKGVARRRRDAVAGEQAGQGNLDERTGPDAANRVEDQARA